MTADAPLLSASLGNTGSNLVQNEGPSRVVAVAGATGGLGKHIVQELLGHGLTVVALARRDVPDYLVSLGLSRHAPSPPPLTVEQIIYPAVPSLGTNHQPSPDERSKSVRSIANILKKHDVDTIISVLDGYGPILLAAETALLDAAIASGVRRFAPSTFSAPMENLKFIRACEPKLRFFEQLKYETRITWTEFATGLFMNYLGFSSPAPADEVTSLGAMGHLLPIPFLLEPCSPSTASPDEASSDLKQVNGGNEPNGHQPWNPLLRSAPSASTDTNLHLLIPGSGDDPIVFTTVEDIAVGVARTCLSPLPWRARTGWMAGCQTTYNEVLSAFSDAGKALGRNYVGLDELKEEARKGREEGGKGWKDPTDGFFAELKVVIAEGGFSFAVPDKAVVRGEGGKGWGTDVRSFVKRWWAPV